MEYRDIVSKYLALDEDLRQCPELSSDIRMVLERGYVCCNNDKVNDSPLLMLTGINPSYDEKHREDFPRECREFTFATAEGRHWTKKKNQFGVLKNSIPYIDLFPIRETHQQRGFENVFREANDIRASFLKITQLAIEDMAPKMIVHANRASMYYWGIKSHGGGNDAFNPWMGYKVEIVTRENTPNLPRCLTNDRLTRFPLYKIVGFIDSGKRINNKEIKNTSLTYIMEYVMEYRNNEDREKYLFKPDEWLELCDWLKK